MGKIKLNEEGETPLENREIGELFYKAADILEYQQV
jgi:hypothetical protein